MSGQRAFKSAPAPAQQPHGRAHRAYTVSQFCEAAEIPRSSFYRLRRTGQLPFLEELKPRIGRVLRYRADLIDRYLAGQWGESRAFRAHERQSRVGAAASPMTQKVIAAEGDL